MLIAWEKKKLNAQTLSWPNLEVQVKEKVNGKQPELEKHWVCHCLCSSLRWEWENDPVPMTGNFWEL